MLSEREARSLREIEQYLALEDQRFAAFMNRPAFEKREHRVRRWYDLVIVLAASSAALCAALASSGTLGAAAVGAGMAVLAWYMRMRRFSCRRTWAWWPILVPDRRL